MKVMRQNNIFEPYDSGRREGLNPRKSSNHDVVFVLHNYIMDAQLKNIFSEHFVIRSELERYRSRHIAIEATRKWA